MVLGKLPVPGRPTNLDKSRTRANCTCSWCGWELFGHFYSHLSFLFSVSLSLGNDPIQTEILSQRVVKTKTTNQPTSKDNISASHLKNSHQRRCQIPPTEGSMCLSKLGKYHPLKNEVRLVIFVCLILTLLFNRCMIIEH